MIQCLLLQEIHCQLAFVCLSSSRQSFYNNFIVPCGKDLTNVLAFYSSIIFPVTKEIGIVVWMQVVKQYKLLSS